MQVVDALLCDTDQRITVNVCLFVCQNLAFYSLLDAVKYRCYPDVIVGFSSPYPRESRRAYATLIS